MVGSTLNNFGHRLQGSLRLLSQPRTKSVLTPQESVALPFRYAYKMSARTDFSGELFWYVWFFLILSRMRGSEGFIL